MSFEMIVGLQIKDDQAYNSYRNAMTPILENYGGSFRYDFRVSQTLKNQEGKPINRVFIISFTCKDNSENFFSDPKYLEVKERFFVASVEHTTIIAQYNLEA